MVKADLPTPINKKLELEYYTHIQAQYKLYIPPPPTMTSLYSRTTHEAVLLSMLINKRGVQSIAST